MLIYTFFVRKQGRGTDGKNYKVDLTSVNDNTSFVDSRNLFNYSSTPNIQTTKKLQRPATAQGYF